MNIRILILILALIIVWTFLTYLGVNKVSLSILLVISVMLAIHYYFATRVRENPTNFEIYVATFWLVLRRIACFIAAVFLFTAAIKPMFFSKDLASYFWFSLGYLYVAIICISVGIYGGDGGVTSLSWPFEENDIADHKKKKSRYKWPW